MCYHVFTGAKSDGIAAEFSDIIEDLTKRIPYLTVGVSTLLPRFDSEEQVSDLNSSLL